MRSAAEDVPSEQRVEDAPPALGGARAAGLAVRVHARGRLRDGGEEGGLGPAQVLDRLPEVAASGVGDAAHAVPVGGDAEVVRQHRRVPVARGEHERRQRLAELPRVGARPRALQARHLHGDGRGARGAPPGAQVLAHAAHDGERVDTRVAPEAPVLDREGRRHDARREARERPVADLRIARVGHLGEEAPVRVAQEEGRFRRHQPDARGEQHDDARERGEAGAAGAGLHRRSAGGATSTRAPAEFPCTLPSYIISACAAGWMKRPPVAARARK